MKRIITITTTIILFAVNVFAYELTTPGIFLKYLPTGYALVDVQGELYGVDSEEFKLHAGDNVKVSFNIQNSTIIDSKIINKEK